MIHPAVGNCPPLWKLYKTFFDAKRIEKGLNRWLVEFFGSLFKKITLFGQYRTVPKFTRLGTGERSPVEQETTIMCHLCLTRLSIIHKFCHPRECFWYHLMYIVYKQFTRRYIGLYQFMMHDPRTHNPVMHDSCINYANMLYII